MGVATLTVGTCQFPVSADIDANFRWIARQATEAAGRGAKVAHFPEGALSGYAGIDFASFEGFDWESLRRASDQLLDIARSQGIWLVVGSAHRLSENRKPHNSVRVIDEGGEIVDRYDKGEGFHRLAWWTEDFDGLMRNADAARWPVVFSGDGNDVANFAYFELDTKISTVVEVMELNDSTRALAETVAKGAEQWDGVTDPVRSLG
jgi:hypothetical protein